MQKDDGALNLLAQIKKYQGDLDSADCLIERAIDLNSNNHLHYFQKALISFKRRTKSSFFLTQWKWHVLLNNQHCLNLLDIF